MKTYFLKYSEFLNESLSSARKRFLEKGYITQSDFDLLVTIDTTPTKKYLDKLCEWFIDGAKPEELTEAISHYENLLLRKVKEIHKDINYYDTFKDFTNELSLYSVAVPKSKIKKNITGSVEYLIDNEYIQIVVPKTREESELFGKGTKWCISSKESIYKTKWVEYYWESQATFYFVWFKDRDPKDRYYKLAIYIYEHSGEIEVRDAKDEIVSDRKAQQLLDEYGNLPISLKTLSGRFKTMTPEQLISDYQREEQLQNDSSIFGRLVKQYPHLRTKKVLDFYKELIKNDNNSRLHWLSDVITKVKELHTPEWFDVLLSKKPDVEDLVAVMDGSKVFNTPENRMLLMITVSESQDILYIMRVLKECQTEEWARLFLKKNDDTSKAVSFIEEFPQFDNDESFSNFISLLEDENKYSYADVMEYMSKSENVENKKKLTTWWLENKKSQLTYLLQFISICEGVILYDGVKEHLDSVMSMPIIEHYIKTSDMLPHWFMGIEDVFKYYISLNPPKEDIKDMVASSSKFRNWWYRYIHKNKK